MQTEWKTTDDPRWLGELVLWTVLAGVVVALNVAQGYGPWWTMLALPVLAGLHLVGAARSRLRLTDDGVEVRGLRTRLYRWSDIASAERAPDWDGAAAVWLRLRGSVQTSAPEVLAPPGVRGRAATSATLDDLVLLIRRRANLNQPA